jgi:hypothetical protein
MTQPEGPHGQTSLSVAPGDLLPLAVVSVPAGVPDPLLDRIDRIDLVDCIVIRVNEVSEVNPVLSPDGSGKRRVAGILALSITRAPLP